MAEIIKTELWKKSLFVIVRTWRYDALKMQMQKIENISSENAWTIEYCESEPWEFAHMINASLWAKVVDDRGKTAIDRSSPLFTMAIEDFTRRAIEKISQYSQEDKKWAFNLHLKTLQLGFYRVKSQMPQNWQDFTWENFPY